PADPRETMTVFVRTKQQNDAVVPAIATLVADLRQHVRDYGTLAQVPAAAVGNVRNDMYLTSESLRLLKVKLDADATRNVAEFKREIDRATKFIPLWVKVAVAIATFTQSGMNFV